MFIFFRWLYKVAKKDHAVLARYERSHPHFLRYLALDAILSIAIVCAGFQIYESHSSSTQRLTHAGNVVMTSGELFNHLREDALTVYWLGPINGDVYTANHETEGIVDLMYLPKETGASDDNSFMYEVKTYKDRTVWDSHTHPILAIASTTTIPLDQQVSIKINKASMKGVVVTYGDKPEIVAIAYPKAQTLSSIIKNVKDLKRIQ